MRTSEPDVLRVGDQLRFSLELVQQIQEYPGSRTVIVKVERIEHGSNGVAKVWLTNVVENT